jgi:predicted N-formylglutamate amidohydrolase
MTAEPHFPAFEKLAPGEGPEDMTDLLLVCDHASNAVPPWATPLGIATQDMERHIAWDVGARGVTLAMSRQLGAPAVLSTFSRLVVDPNRAADDPTLIMKLYDGSIIQGNRNLSAGERQRRVEELHRPYHEAIDTELDRMLDAGASPAIVSIHSFTPQLKGRPQRPWHIGLLWDSDDRLVDPLMKRLAAIQEMMVGDNEPYSGQLRGDCMWMHGTARDIPHVLIEIRNDLIETAEGQQLWADRLAPLVRDAVGEMRLADTEPLTISE